MFRPLKGRRPAGKHDAAIAIQQMLAVIQVNRSVYLGQHVPVIPIPEVQHAETLFGCVHRHLTDL